MQIVGMQCAVCGKPINFAPDGQTCAKCEKAYHRVCLADGVTCPACAENLETQSAQIDKRERENIVGRLRVGRAEFFLAVVLLGGLMLLNAIGSLVAPDLPDVMRVNPWTGLLVLVGLLVALYLGYFVARVLLGLQVAFGVLCQVAWLHRTYQEHGLAAVILNSWIIGILLVSFFLLCLSPSVSLYIESKRAHKES